MTREAPDDIEIQLLLEALFQAREPRRIAVFGRINADQFCERIQKKADATKKDDAVTKFKR